ncbi:MAG: response regulator [Candidatus Omnitrophica bacterium]|nr:response regulator [Candidatus Omnitrophota bacterium]
MGFDRIEVLLVEDDPGDRRLVEEMLSDRRAYGPLSTRFRVLTAESIQQGIDEIRKRASDVILLDISLGDSWGLETLDKMMDASGGIPVVVFTGNDDDGMAMQAMDRGAQDYLVKGFLEATGLRRSIRYALDRSRLMNRLEESSEARFRSIIEKNPDGVLIIGMDACILYANPAAETIFAREAGRMVGGQFHFPLKLAHATEIELDRPDGTSLIGEMLMAEISWEKQPAKLVTIRDVTELKGIERLKAEIERGKGASHQREAVPPACGHRAGDDLDV